MLSRGFVSQYVELCMWNELDELPATGTSGMEFSFYHHRDNVMSQST